MRRAIHSLTIGGLLAMGGGFGAQAADVTSPAGAAAVATALVPHSAFFAGFGGSFNSTRFPDQNVYAQGVSAIYTDDELYAVGAAGGSTSPGFGTESTFAPGAQAGYFSHFDNSQWLWGVKASYNYLGAEATSENIAVPQEGGFTGGNTASFTGNVVIHSYDTSIENQILLMPFVGRSFDKSYFYFGAGPTLSQVKSTLKGVVGFADINGTHYDITGTPSSFSTTDDWVVGRAVTAGATYFFTPKWFLDASYTFAMTKTKTNDFSTPFSTSTDGYTDVGILSGDYGTSTSTQSVMVSINRAF